MNDVIRLTPRRPLPAVPPNPSMKDDARFALALAVLATGAAASAVSPFAAVWVLVGVLGFA